MSQSAELEIVVVGMASLIKAVVECGLQYAESRKFQTDDGKTHEVDVVVEDAKTGAKVGVKLDRKTKVATFVAHDCKGKLGQELTKKIAQRYAYSKVIEELKRKGYQIGKEVKQKDGTIELVATKWK